MSDHRYAKQEVGRSWRPKSGAAWAAALLLAGCAVGPDYHRPANRLPDDYDAAAAAATDAASPATLRSDWWKLYNDPILDDLVEAAIANNPNIRLVIARVDEARAALRETNALFFPEVDYSGIGARARSGAAGGSVGGSTTAGTGKPVYGNFFSVDASVSYELDLWGRLRRLSESAKGSLLSTTYARDVAILALESTTVQSYFALRSLDAQISVTQNTLQAVGDSLDIARKRLDAGFSSALDYLQAETLRAQTQVNLRDLRRQRAVEEHQLANLTSNLSLHIAAGDIDSLPVPAAPPPGLPSTLLERRPDVARDEQAVVATNAQIGVAKAAMFPTLSLTGAYGGQSFDLSDLLKAPFRFWNFGLGISGPIFAGGKYVARLDEARSRNDQQIATYQTTVEGAFQEVADALTNVSESNASFPEVMTQVDAARRTLRLSRLRYQSGFSPYLDVLDATRQANLAELTLVQNRASRLNFSVDLFKALGGGWSDPAVASGPPTDAPAAPAAVSSR
jgi:outer membrane protein, multidrug efflux system